MRRWIVSEVCIVTNLNKSKEDFLYTFFVSETRVELFRLITFVQK